MVSNTAMSYATKLKDELAERLPKGRHCRIAELAAIFSVIGEVAYDGDSPEMVLRAEQKGLRKKCFTLLNKTIRIENAGEGLFLLGQGAKEFLEMVKYDPEESDLVNQSLLEQRCCRRAYLRGMFLSAGSISDPSKGYHFEIVAKDQKQADLILRMMDSFDVHGKTVERQGRVVVYLKESDEISDMLNIMEAPVTLLDFENIRIQKGMNNAVNRKVNCETANIGKMVNAAVREVRDIHLIRDTRGLGSLPERLRVTAELRLEHPDASLIELGQMMNPPVGKSGVNHRLRRISAIAESIRNENQEGN